MRYLRGFSEESRTGCRNRLKRFRAPVVSGFPADEMTIMTYTIDRSNDSAEKAVYRQMIDEKWKRCVERGEALLPSSCTGEVRE
jgi:hypothetical protein